MTVFVCLDDRNGMLFNNRRQSRDAAVLEDIRSRISAPLTIDAFSEKLILQAGIPYVLAPESLEEADPSGAFFSECRCSDVLCAAAHTLVIYRWNRHYPADLRWTTDLNEAGFRLVQTEEFPGNSHEIITREVYTR